MRQRLASIDEIKAYVGQPAVTSEGIVVDQAMIDLFGGVTQDTQWIHTDPVRAANESPFKGTIAHGLLTLSLITGWYHRCFEFPNRKLALNYGFDKVRFTGPVPSGSTLVGSFRLQRADDIGPGEVRCVWNVDVRLEGAERPVMVAVWLMQIRY